MIRNVERQPDEHFRWQAESLWADNIQSVSDFLGSKPDNLVFVANTTTGLIYFEFK